MDELIGAAEVADILGVSRSRVHRLRERANFPAPRWVLACGPIWEAADIRAYAELPRLTGRPAMRH